MLIIKRLFTNYCSYSYIFLGVLTRFPLYSRLTKTTAKKPCFSKSGDAAAIVNAAVRFYKLFSGIPPLLLLI